VVLLRDEVVGVEEVDVAEVGAGHGHGFLRRLAQVAAGLRTGRPDPSI
jgi:hypothetical protein